MQNESVKVYNFAFLPLEAKAFSFTIEYHVNCEFNF